MPGRARQLMNGTANAIGEEDEVVAPYEIMRWWKAEEER